MHRYLEPLKWIKLRFKGPRLPDQRKAFERYEAKLLKATDNVAGLPDDNRGGALAWGSSWRMQGYLMMAETTGDPSYIQRLSVFLDEVLEKRDNVLGNVDFRGDSLPVWSAARRYTGVIHTVHDTEGRPAFELRLTPPRLIGTKVTVTPHEDGTFDLTIDRPFKVFHELKGLSLDPDSPQRADKVAYDGYTVKNGTTIKLLPAPEGVAPAGRRLAADTFEPDPIRATQIAHTGMIVYPFAALARMAKERPELVPAEVHAKIDGYLKAVADALAVHDDQWRVTADGEGHYVWLRDEPVSHAGVELPTNEFLTVGRAMIHLAAATGDPAYAEKAHAMAVMLRKQMEEDGDSFTWPYWPSFGHVYRGWQRTGDVATDISDFRPEFHAIPVAEDVTHALVDVDFACLYARTPSLPPVFTEADMRRLAQTFTSRVVKNRFARRPQIQRHITGVGKMGGPRDEAHVACWLPLRQWAPQVTRPALTVYQARRPSAIEGVDGYLAALIYRWGREDFLPTP